MSNKIKNWIGICMFILLVVSSLIWSFEQTSYIEGMKILGTIFGLMTWLGVSVYLIIK